MATEGIKDEIRNGIKDILEGIRWGTLAVVIFIFIIISSIILKGTSYFTEATTIEITSVMSNFVLSLFLIMIYAQIRDAEKAQAEESEHQREILEAQKETQREQQKLFKANHQPLIRELEWKPLEVNGKEGVYIRCVNKGNGPAKNLKLKCEISVLEPSDEKLLIYSNIGDVIDGVKGKDSPLVKDRSAYSRGADGAVLSEGEEDCQFFSALEFSKVTTKQGSKRVEKPFSFKYTIEHLEDEGYRNYHLELSLCYENILGETESYSFFDCKGNTNTDFASMIRKANGENKAEDGSGISFL